MPFPPVPSSYDTPQDRSDAAAFLTAGRVIIASPDAWAPRCQWALDPDGAAVDAHDPLAVRWSATAALRVAAQRASGNAVWLAWTALDNSVGPSFSAFEWAADTTHEVMLRVFNLAIARLSMIASDENVAPDLGDQGHQDAAAVHDLAARTANELCDDAIDPVADLDMAQRRGLLLLAASTEREGARRAGVEPADADVLRSNVDALRDLDGPKS